MSIIVARLCLFTIKHHNKTNSNCICLNNNVLLHIHLLKKYVIFSKMAYKNFYFAWCDSALGVTFSIVATALYYAIII